MLTTVGQVLVNDALPPRFRDYERVMDSKGIESVLEQIALEAPEEYSGVTKRLMDVGNAAAFDTGTTIRLSDLRPAYDKKPVLQAIDVAEDKIRNDKTLTNAQKSEMIEKLYDKASARITEDTFNAEFARRNQLALQVASKARGTQGQLAAFISTPGTYSTPSGKMVPMFIRHSFAEGLTPAEYWAGSFGARNGVVSTKTATAKGGAFGKLLSASAVAQVVTEEDCGTEGGLPVKVDDDDNIGAVLAKPAGGYEAGTVITKNVLSDLRKDKRHDEIVVRSPVTCGCKDGVCSKCAGIRETGGFPPIGYNLGTNAASAFAERIAQGALNCLAEGTMVRMSDGSVKPIEKIRPGETVMGCDLKGNLSPTEVLNWWDNGIQPCYRATFANGDYIAHFESTIIHKILCRIDGGSLNKFEIGVNGYMEALINRPVADGHKSSFVPRVSLEPIGDKHVYDIEVECDSHLFLLENGINCSNTKHCLAEGTLVRMADWSTKPIEDVRTGDLVIGSDKEGQLSPVRVTNTFDNGFEPCVRTVFRKLRGRVTAEDVVLESTTNHKVLGVASNTTDTTRHKPRKPIKVGDKAKRFIAAIPQRFNDSGYIDEPLALLLGVIMGDGCYTRSVNGVYVSCSDVKEVCALNDYLAPMNLKLQRLKYHDGIYYRVSMVSSSSADRHGNPVKNYLIKNGMYGKFAHTKDVPDVIYSWSNRSIADFIGGFIAADGSVCVSADGGGILAIASTSRDLLLHLKELLLVRFGIQTSALTRTGKTGSVITAVQKQYGLYYRKHDQYQFTISDAQMLQRLYSNITIPGEKQDKLEQIICNIRGRRRLVNCDYGMKRIAQEDIGIRHVYDITVNNADHLFLLANGLIVSNSGKSIKGKGTYQGFNMFTALAKVPKAYPDRAALSTTDGTVTKIEDAPQGGTYVTIDNGTEDKRVYVAPGYDLEVKVGQEVEAGDQISDGVIDPSELVGYKGIGEGRKYWASRFTKAMRDSGFAANRRNAEVLARTVMNTVRLDDEDSAGEGLPGDVLTYTAWSYGYKPRKNSSIVAPTVASLGKYLEQPVLHYTIGTRITPSVIKTMKKFKVDQMMVNDAKPDVTPFMERIEDSNAEKKDWMARLSTTYLKSRLMEDVARGAESHLHSTEPYPGIAKGVEFGDWGQPLSKNKSETFTY